MLLSFVDETSDSKYPEYFGLCIATINSVHYGSVKTAFQQILIDNGWNPEIEFKGSYLFSVSKGCRDVTVEKRVTIASSILDLTASEKNARIKFYYLKTKAKDHKTTYLRFLPILLKKLYLPPPGRAVKICWLSIVINGMILMKRQSAKP